MIEDKREPNPTMDAIYFLAPKPHIVECLLADFNRDCYKRGYLVWAGVLGRELQSKVGTISRHKIAGTEFRIPSCRLWLTQVPQFGKPCSSTISPASLTW